MDFSAMTLSQLLTYYNQNSYTPTSKFENRTVAEKRCAELYAKLNVKTKLPEQLIKSVSMKDSLKLDRTIICVNTGGVWDNPHQLWVERPEWMSSSQQDRLTAKLYSAAKRGEQITVEVNGRKFKLKNVGVNK